jgi:hypothetical protein
MQTLNYSGLEWGRPLKRSDADQLERSERTSSIPRPPSAAARVVDIAGRPAKIEQFVGVVAETAIPRVPPTSGQKRPHHAQLVQELRHVCLTSSAWFAGQQTERELLFHQNMTGRSRHRIVDSPNLGFLGRGDRSNASTEVREPNFREFRSERRDINMLALPTQGRWLCCALGPSVPSGARNAQ